MDSDQQAQLSDLVTRTQALVAGAGGSSELAERAAARLRDSVIRPLSDVTGSQGQADGVDGGLDALWELALDATRLRVASAAPNELIEATAALQDVVCELSGDDDPRIHSLRELQRDLPFSIRVQHDGPYLVTNPQALTDALGQELPTRPQMALCRCGESAIKPLCDGAHARIGFDGAKSADRVEDRLDSYAGQQVTVLDNRGTCQHSGFCTDRLAAVFHTGSEPFVTPSGGRMDEIIRAVRDCPSGALSYAVDGLEARAQVDHGGKREPAIEVSKDGPYRVTGAVELTDSDGKRQARNAGASLEHYALCRCGHSLNKPFCSGMHWTVEFRDPVPDPDGVPTMFEWCGGLPALTRMTRLFYEKLVPEDPLLAPLFAEMSPDHPQRVAKWLGEVFGGPPSYSGEYGGYHRMLSQHLGKGLSEERRARWVELISRAAQEAGLPNDAEFCSAFSSYIEWGSRLALENSQAGAKPPENMPMPRWEWGMAGPPGSRISALAPQSDEPEPEVVLPATDEPVSFEAHIKGLFRERDRSSMRFAFDLGAYDDVAEHAPAILERLRNGSMPCDGAWPQERIDVFARWIDAGSPA